VSNQEIERRASYSIDLSLPTFIFYSICERHYNQIVATNHFHTCNFTDLLVEYEETKRRLQFTQQESHQKRKREKVY